MPRTDLSMLVRAEHEITEALSAVSLTHGVVYLAELGGYSDHAQVSRAAAGEGHLSLVRYKLITERLADARGDLRLADAMTGARFRMQPVRPGAANHAIDDDLAELVEALGRLRAAWTGAMVHERLRLIDDARHELDDLEAEAVSWDTRRAA